MAKRPHQPAAALRKRAPRKAPSRPRPPKPRPLAPPLSEQIEAAEARVRALEAAAEAELESASALISAERKRLAAIARYEAMPPTKHTRRMLRGLYAGKGTQAARGHKVGEAARRRAGALGRLQRGEIKITSAQKMRAKKFILRQAAKTKLYTGREVEAWHEVLPILERTGFGLIAELMELQRQLHQEWKALGKPMAAGQGGGDPMIGDIATFYAMMRASLGAYREQIWVLFYHT